MGDVVLAGVKQGLGFLGPELEEARACYFVLCTAATHRFGNLVVEGDSQGLIYKLQKKDIPSNSLGFFISDIISLLARFDFVSWNFVRRGCNLRSGYKGHVYLH